MLFSDEIMCPTLPNPENGMVSWTNLTENGIATYSCNDGFTLEGSEVRICREGLWSSEAPLCTGTYVLKNLTWHMVHSVGYGIWCWSVYYYAVLCFT